MNRGFTRGVPALPFTALTHGVTAFIIQVQSAGVVELVDTGDLKSPGRKAMPVQVRSPAKRWAYAVAYRTAHRHSSRSTVYRT